jgi:hypothetical protein
MRFANVDGQKIGVVFVVVVDLDDVANLATKRRSGETAEDENERFAAGAFADMKARAAVERDESGVWGVAADLEIASVHMRKGVADHADGIFGAACHDAEANADGEEKDGDGDQGPFEDGMHGFALHRYRLISRGKFLGCWKRKEFNAESAEKRNPRGWLKSQRYTEE